MNRKQVGAWALFDFANSIYPAVVQTAVFSVFYTTVIVGNEEGRGDFWWGLGGSLSVLIVATSAPLLGAIADRGGLRKRLMLLLTILCLAGVALFTTLEPGMILLGLLFYVIANVGFEGSLVFYNAYLPDIVPPDKQGRVSGLGFGLGYLGSAVGLVLALVILRFLDLPIQWVWVSTVVFYALFSIPAFRLLPADRTPEMGIREAARWGLTHLRTIIAEVLALKDMRRFLLAYFFFIDGINTVIVMAGTIASSTFGFTSQQVILLFLVVQFAALIGAFVMARPTDTWGPKRVVSLSLLLWVAVGCSVFLIRSQAAFVTLAVLVGLGLGSAQAASRALMSSLVPEGREAEMFGFYAFCGKSSSMMGPALFGIVSGSTGGNQRLGILALTGLMAIGLALLQRVRDPRSPGATRLPAHAAP